MTVHTVRVAKPEDVETLVELCAEHAAFERASYEKEGKSDELSAALFGVVPRVQAWFAIVEDEVVGYAAATEDVSNWIAAWEKCSGNRQPGTPMAAASKIVTAPLRTRKSGSA